MLGKTVYTYIFKTMLKHEHTTLNSPVTKEKRAILRFIKNKK